MLKTEDFNSLSQAHTGDRLQHIIQDFPLVAKVTTGAPVGGITLSCDDLTLAVVTAQSDIGFLYFYDVRAFAGQVGLLLTISSSPDMSRDMRFSTMWYFGKCRLRRACAASF